jgi:hypothetical protein
MAPRAGAKRVVVGDGVARETLETDGRTSAERAGQVSSASAATSRATSCAVL